MMKKWLISVLAVLVGLSLTACAEKSPQPGKADFPEKYDALIGMLDQGEYEAAQSYIQEMARQDDEEVVHTSEPTTAAPELPAMETEPESQPKGTSVELTEYNVNDYFEVKESYSAGEQAGCVFFVVLKEEFRDKLLSGSQVSVEVSYLPMVHYGRPEGEGFETEYFDPISAEVRTKQVSIGDTGEGFFLGCSYDSRKGCFTEYPLEIMLTNAQGILVFDDV